MRKDYRRKIIAAADSCNVARLLNNAKDDDVANASLGLSVGDALSDVDGSLLGLRFDCSLGAALEVVDGSELDSFVVVCVTGCIEGRADCVDADALVSRVAGSVVLF